MTLTHDRAPGPRVEATPRHAVLFESPSGAPAPGAAAPVDVRAHGRARRRGVARVWVVDDDPVVCLYLADLLAARGYEVVTFSDPRRALGAFLTNPCGVDVVVTDQRMPSLCGDRLAGEMFSLRPDVRIILCTGYEDTTSEARAFELGIRHVFHKPFDSRALLRAVHGDAENN